MANANKTDKTQKVGITSHGSFVVYINLGTRHRSPLN